MDTAILIVGIVNGVLLAVILIRMYLGKDRTDPASLIASVKEGLAGPQRELREEVSGSVQTSVRTLGESITAMQKTLGDSQAERLTQVDRHMTELQSDVGDKLERIRTVVDDRLQTTLDERMTGFRTAVCDAQRQTGDAQKTQLDTMDRKLSDTLQTMSRSMNERQEQSAKAVQDKLAILETRFQTLEASNNERLEAIKRTVGEHLDRLTETNQKKLDGIQSMVSEKLESNLRESFRLVSERLEQVSKGLGEMQSVAAGVGDLKKVLSNIKTRGIMGEIQLEMILSEILAPEQYQHEIATIPGSKAHVEFAVRLPGTDGSSEVYLPIDSKVPGDTYRSLQEAYDAGDRSAIEAAKKKLRTVMLKCAADIRSKYVEPPYTTNFGVMFLPFEGLYAEVAGSGLLEELQRTYSVIVTGPSTLAAMLNALQMGFRTLAVQQRSIEVWKILGEAKSEFEKFADVLKSAQDKLAKASDDLEKLVGVRTRAITPKLSTVETLEYAAPKPPDSGGGEEEA